MAKAIQIHGANLGDNVVVVADRERIKAFVQDVLGCGCAEDVFDFVDVRREVAHGRAYERINVGNRLLIYVYDAGEGRFAPDDLKDVVATGRQERDRQGFNRFRLVLVTDEATVHDAALKAFRGLGFVDDRVHLHVIKKALARH